MPPTSKLFLSGCRRRPSEKTAIQVRYVQPFSVATLKWGLEGATKVRSLSRAMAVFLKNPGKIFCINIQQLRRARTKLLNVDTKNLPRTETVSASTTFSYAQEHGTIRTKDAKYHGSNLNNKLDKKVPTVFVAGAALWDACCSFVWQALGFGSMMAVLRGPAMQLTCNTHATHSQHNTQHEHFPVNSQ